MADWDADSPRLRRNLEAALRDARDRAVRRQPLSIEDLRRWHRASMAGLRVPTPECAGRFRGEVGLEGRQVWVGSLQGVTPSRVAAEVEAFGAALGEKVADLDRRYLPQRDLDRPGLARVLDLCGWAHAEWVRIHPFANGNGRTARILANALLMRYGIPPVIRLRPRPDGGYAQGAAAAMRGRWRPTAEVFRRLVREALASALERDPGPQRRRRMRRGGR